MSERGIEIPPPQKYEKKRTRSLFAQDFPSFPDIFVNPPPIVVVCLSLRYGTRGNFLVYIAFFLLPTPISVTLALSSGEWAISRGPSPVIYIVERRMKNDSISEGNNSPRRSQPILGTYFWIIFCCRSKSKEFYETNCKRGRPATFATAEAFGASGSTEEIMQMSMANVRPIWEHSGELWNAGLEHRKSHSVKDRGWGHTNRVRAKIPPGPKQRPLSYLA